MGRLRPTSLRGRLTLWYGGALAIVLVLYAVTVQLSLYFELRENLDNNLREDLEIAVPTFERGIQKGTVGTGKQNAVPDGRDERRLEVWSLSGKLLFATGERNAGLDRPNLERLKNGFFSRRLSEQGTVRILQDIREVGGQKVIIRAIRSEQELWQELKELFLVQTVSFPIAVGAAVLGGYGLARRALSPVGKMVHHARRITAEQLDERLPVVDPHDELGKLAETFNETFRRIETSFEQLRRFTADASHELRTPLTNIQSVGEVGLRSNSDQNGYRETIQSMLEEVEHLNRLVEKLLVLSRADSDRFTLNPTAIDVSALVEEAVRDMEVLAEEKQQTIERPRDGPLWIQGNRVILRRALVNLLDNAIKYSPLKGKVWIHISAQTECVAVEIRDSGPGISRDDLPYIFDRFYRADKARTRALRGTGLGLSIAQWVVEVHGGSIDLDSRVGDGCCFCIRLPRQDQNQMPKERTV